MKSPISSIHKSTVLFSSLVAATLCSFLFLAASCSTGQPTGTRPDSSSPSSPQAQKQLGPNPLLEEMVTDSPVITPAPQASAAKPHKPKTAPASKTLSPDPKIDEALLATLDPAWVPLVLQLKEELPTLPVEEYFNGLPASSGKIMAKKIHELHHYNFVVKPSKKKDEDKKIIPEYEKSPVFEQFLTQDGMDKCNAFLTKYSSAFDLAEKRHEVPREVIAALLYVETRLGVYVGKTKAFWSLASMAASTTPESIQEDLKVTILPEQEEWLQEKLDEKARWAYREVKALLAHCERNNIDPRELVGSEYGAIGICQFMPTNLEAYTDDGDGDGIIDLFNPNDAILSTAKFLAVHNWAKAEDIAAQRKVIMRYNISSRYANTVLALAESLHTGSLKKAQADAPSRQTQDTQTASSKAPQTTETKHDSGEKAEAEQTKSPEQTANT